MVFLVTYYLRVNMVGFGFAVFDKFAAVTSSILPLRRISESSLLLLAGLGAFPGHSVAFMLFNHKTRKRTC